MRLGKAMKVFSVSATSQTKSSWVTAPTSTNSVHNTRIRFFDRGADQILPALFAVVGPAEDGGEGENGERDGEELATEARKAAVSRPR